MTQLNISNYGSTTSQTLNDDDLELECISLLRKMKEKKKAGLLPLVGRSGPRGMDGDAGRIPALCAGISAPPAVQRDSSAAASARVFRLAVACGLCLTNPASPSQGSTFRSNFAEISVFFSFSLVTGKRNFSIFRHFSFSNLKIQ